jgi:uncharacterized HAD superfamily protein
MNNDNWKKEFTEFQKLEYSNISGAHFETNKQIALFFRYFLLIASVPAIIVLLYDKNINKIAELFLGKVSIYETVFVSAILMIISVLGFFTFLYITNLLNDSILYAKTVNGARKYFYELIDDDKKERYRVLPIVTCEPNKDNLKRISFPILLCISLTNSAYFSLSTYILSIQGHDFFTKSFKLKHLVFNNYTLYHVIGLAIILLMIHWFVAKYITNFREYSYLKSNIIGIDIDGVLNKHRRTFCTLLYKYTNKTLWEDEVIKVPVSLIPNKGITRHDEFIVFNNQKYWIVQKVFDDKTADTIDELRNSFGYKICIFSNRPWPDTKYLSENEKYGVLKKWWSIKCFGKTRQLPLLKILSTTQLYKNKLRYFKIKKITKRWLKKVQINYDKLIIETSSVDNPPAKTLGQIPRPSFRNRYYFARKQHFRYFVEDIPENAIKLSLSCDYIFLIEQPYNSQVDYPDLPKNIIRVKNWSAIKEKIRELG